MSLFETAFTQANNIARIQALRPDLASAGVDTAAEILAWYNAFGFNELTGGSNPAPLTGLDTAHIASIRPDLAAAGITTAKQIIDWYFNTAAMVWLVALHQMQPSTQRLTLPVALTGLTLLA